MRCSPIMTTVSPISTALVSKPRMSKVLNCNSRAPAAGLGVVLGDGLAPEDRGLAGRQQGRVGGVEPGEAFGILRVVCSDEGGHAGDNWVVLCLGGGAEGKQEPEGEDRQAKHGGGFQ